MKTIILNNKTRYFSKDLTKLFTLVLREYKRTTFDFKHKIVNVTCIYRRWNDRQCSGSVEYYNSNNILIKIPKNYKKSKLSFSQQERINYKNLIEEYVGQEIKEDGDTLEQSITRTFLHLLDFCRGRTNGKIISSELRDISYLPEDLIIREKKSPIKKKKTVDIKVTKLLERKKKWESKLMRCENAITKINRQVKYYEKKQNSTESV